MTEISLIVTLNKQFNIDNWEKDVLQIKLYSRHKQKQTHLVNAMFLLAGKIFQT